jgi:hypothetical protein
VLAGVDDAPETVLPNARDCFLLSLGLPFWFATDLSLEPVHYAIACARLGIRSEPVPQNGGVL